MGDIQTVEVRVDLDHAIVEDGQAAVVDQWKMIVVGQDQNQDLDLHRIEDEGLDRLHVRDQHLPENRTGAVKVLDVDHRLERRLEVGPEKEGDHPQDLEVDRLVLRWILLVGEEAFHRGKLSRQHALKMHLGQKEVWRRDLVVRRLLMIKEYRPPYQWT